MAWHWHALYEHDQSAQAENIQDVEQKFACYPNYITGG